MLVRMSFAIMLLPASLALAACQAPGGSLRANDGSLDQLNIIRDAKVIKILAVFPALIAADDAQSLLGGSVIGSNAARDRRNGTGFGTLAPGGSLVPETEPVDGVSITYEQGNKTLHSAQAGQVCEFIAGKAIMISTSPTEARIQPNAKCRQIAAK